MTTTTKRKDYLKQKQISLITNECYLLNQWLQHQRTDSIIDGKLVDFIQQHRENDIEKKQNHLYKVTFKLIPQRVYKRKPTKGDKR